jgi:hypothetical protein
MIARRAANGAREEASCRSALEGVLQIGHRIEFLIMIDAEVPGRRFEQTPPVAGGGEPAPTSAALDPKPADRAAD